MFVKALIYVGLLLSNLLLELDSVLMAFHTHTSAPRGNIFIHFIVLCCLAFSFLCTSNFSYSMYSLLIFRRVDAWHSAIQCCCEFLFPHCAQLALLWYSSAVFAVLTWLSMCQRPSHISFTLCDEFRRDDLCPLYACAARAGVE